MPMHLSADEQEAFYDEPLSSLLRVYQEWQAGQVPAESALEQLCEQLAQLKEQIEPLEAAQRQIRSWLTQVVESVGGKVEVTNFGQLQLTQPTIVINYDRKQLDQLLHQLVAQGQTEIAQAVERCRHQSTRAGGLRITGVRNQLEESNCATT